MKKLMALVALVAMVALSSVAYGQGSDAVQVDTSVSTGTATITGCTATIPALGIADKNSDTCDLSVTHNNVAGYNLAFGNTTTDEMRSIASYATDPNSVIVALVESDSAITNGTTCAAGTECWSFYISSITDSDAAAELDDQTGGSSGQGNNPQDAAFAPFDDTAVEHAVDTTAETILDSTSTGYSGVAATLTFSASIDSTTPARSDYRNTASATLALN